ncbi:MULTISPECIES: GNAT family N-acetyltransferase [Micromonospora]|uniref:GCN5 family acetyltransferase n=1 Tax=Micromonospora maris TaxID=1003110 RepID=A0A9X0LC77_9ACTN|nr:GNAT family N-acetyltransferase [Micromonospora maris]AEB45432.1 GCN5-related N-acetyltransferase [Micromonospora maris AB-18-032]KUJ44814.1 GCN5 family acetyltransferase [Micromonospora maris]
MSSRAAITTIDGVGSTVDITNQVKVETLAEVYRRVHAHDLHLVDHRAPTVEERLQWTVDAPGFEAALGYVDGYLVGAVAGCPLPPETLWWRDLTAADDPDLAVEWPGRTFAVCEAFVLPEFRRHRLGIRMTTELLTRRGEERVCLAVAETNTRVWHALQRTGFRHVGDLVPFPGWRPHRMLVRALPLTRTP